MTDRLQFWQKYLRTLRDADLCAVKTRGMKRDELHALLEVISSDQRIAGCWDVAAEWFAIFGSGNGRRIVSIVVSMSIWRVNTTWFAAVFGIARGSAAIARRSVTVSCASAASNDGLAAR